MDQNELLQNLDHMYGITVEEVPSFNNEDSSYIKIDKDKLNRFGAAFNNAPYFAKILADKKHYSGAYKVIFNEGIGTLQRSAKTPGLFRANVVQYGTNNKMVAQAELSPLNPTELMELSQIVLSVYSVASVLTNQYFLARIDKKLDSLEKTTADIKRFLETDKKTLQITECEFLEQSMKNVEFIENNPMYAQATLVSLQRIKINASANMKLYKEEIVTLINTISKKDKVKDYTLLTEKYKCLFPQYWLAVLIYGLSSYMECRLSGITDEEYLTNAQIDILNKIKQYKSDYVDFDIAIHEYLYSIKGLKGIKQLENIALVLGSVAGFAAFGIWGIKLGKGAAEFAEEYNESREESREKFNQDFRSFQKIYSDFEQLTSPVKALDLLNTIYNQQIEIVVDDENIYMKTDPEKQELAMKKALSES